jgi:hypothetical protein
LIHTQLHFSVKCAGGRKEKQKREKAVPPVDDWSSGI